MLVGSPEVQVHVRAKRCDYTAIDDKVNLKSGTVFRLTLHYAIIQSEILRFHKEMGRRTQGKRRPMLNPSMNISAKKSNVGHLESNLAN